MALSVVCVGLVVTDVVQRLVVAPWVALRPARRIPVLGRWQQFLARFVLWGVRLGGASIPPPPTRIPSGPGHLILMNHQSLFDIPLVVRTIENGYPRIVTRARYSRLIPTISHMTRLYQYPTVDPSATKSELARMLEELVQTGRESDVPIVVFPEGRRSRDGSIGRFRPGGVSRLLSARPWTVHVLVADGFWKAARFSDLLGGMRDIHGTFAYAGSIEWTDPEADPEPLLEEVRARMKKALAELRRSSAPV